ncbi:MAG: hypothetical protein AB1679_18400 [Actinomycetota bacterium]|jgi:hypothetical protein
MIKARGAVKRLVFLVGVVAVTLGALILMDPVAAGDHNCGTALTPKQFVLPENAERCETQIRRRRWLGTGILAVGAVALILAGPRCLLADD